MIAFAHDWPINCHKPNLQGQGAWSGNRIVSEPVSLMSSVFTLAPDFLGVHLGPKSLSEHLGHQGTWWTPQISGTLAPCWSYFQTLGVSTDPWVQTSWQWAWDFALFCGTMSLVNYLFISDAQTWAGPLLPFSIMFYPWSLEVEL